MITETQSDYYGKLEYDEDSIIDAIVEHGFFHKGPLTWSDKTEESIKNLLDLGIIRVTDDKTEFNWSYTYIANQ